jgi:hypothetical protein
MTFSGSLSATLEVGSQFPTADQKETEAKAAEQGASMKTKSSRTKSWSSSFIPFYRRSDDEVYFTILRLFDGLLTLSHSGDGL